MTNDTAGEQEQPRQKGGGPSSRETARGARHKNTDLRRGAVDRFARATAIVGITLSIIGLGISLWSSYNSWKAGQEARDLKVYGLLNEAWDLLGGEEGEPFPGTRVVHYKSPVDRRQLELASRKISEALILDPGVLHHRVEQGVFEGERKNFRSVSDASSRCNHAIERR